MPRPGFVYILASKPNGTLYIGVTSDLVQRMQEHRDGAVEGFTKRYDVHRLVHIEQYDDIREAVERERRLKRWNRAWKLDLIRTSNPTWRDLVEDLAQLRW
ncbi:MAG: GIY-YIG nuclease family protein [Bacteroidota bacterium]